MKAVSLFAIALIALPASVLAQIKPVAPAVPSGASAPKAVPMADGEIRRINKAAGTMTLRHGPIPNLNMPAMTMDYKVANPKFLDAFRPGDKVRFTADRIGDDYTVTRLEAAK
jgi:Cu(I)/Ag(I) efflux system periplasmic protein CusF